MDNSKLKASERLHEIVSRILTVNPSLSPLEAAVIFYEPSSKRVYATRVNRAEYKNGSAWIDKGELTDLTDKTFEYFLEKFLPKPKKGVSEKVAVVLCDIYIGSSLKETSVSLCYGDHSLNALSGYIFELYIQSELNN